jgi:hypothetical protein
VVVERSIVDLKGRYIDYDLYILASGPSAEYIDPDFFNNKIVIGVNEVWIRFSNLDYLVRKETARSQGAYESGIPLIVSRYNCGTLTGTRSGFEGGDRPYYVFEHNNNGLKEIDLSVVGTDKIVVSYSTITSAIHIAAYMGAANVIVIGHDCGTLDGKLRMGALPEAIAGDRFYRSFITEIEPQTLALRERLKEVYNCNVYSLNPFINFGLEGHKYER